MPNKFDQIDVLRPPQVPFKEATEESPANALPAVGVAITLPLGIGLVILVAFFLLSIGLEWKPIWKAPTVASGIVMILMALYWGFNGAEKIMWQVRSIIGITPPQEEGINEPIATPPRVIVEAQAADGSNSWALAELPGDRLLIAEWIKDACERKSLAEDLWEPRFGYTTSKYGKQISVYTVFKKVLGDRNWLIDRGSHGVILSNEGKRVLSGALPQLQQLALPEGLNDE